MADIPQIKGKWYHPTPNILIYFPDIFRNLVFNGEIASFDFYDTLVDRETNKILFNRKRILKKYYDKGITLLVIAKFKGYKDEQFIIINDFIKNIDVPIIIIASFDRNEDLEIKKILDNILKKKIEKAFYSGFNTKDNRDFAKLMGFDFHTHDEIFEFIPLDVKELILLEIDDPETLFNTCKSDRDFNEICENNLFWRRKIKRDFYLEVLPNYEFAKRDWKVLKNMTPRALLYKFRSNNLYFGLKHLVKTEGLFPFTQYDINFIIKEAEKREDDDFLKFIYQESRINYVI